MSGVDAAGEFEKPSGFSLAMNFVPVAHLASGIALASFGADSSGGGMVLLAGWIYLLPPLLARALIAVFGRPDGRLTQEMTAYRVWWVLTQLQTIFNRMPWLEEALRLVPGLYPLWIWLWGGRVSASAYIGPGVVITDRYTTHVAAGAVLGFKAALAGHMVVREGGRFVVIVAAPIVEREAMMGGAAGLGPGARLRAGAVLPTGRRVGPFDSWPREAARERAP